MLQLQGRRLRRCYCLSLRARCLPGAVPPLFLATAAAVMTCMWLLASGGKQRRGGGAAAAAHHHHPTHPGWWWRSTCTWWLLHHHNSYVTCCNHPARPLAPPPSSSARRRALPAVCLRPSLCSSNSQRSLGRQVGQSSPPRRLVRLASRCDAAVRRTTAAKKSNSQPAVLATTQPAGCWRAENCFEQGSKKKPARAGRRRRRGGGGAAGAPPAVRAQKCSCLLCCALGRSKCSS